MSRFIFSFAVIFTGIASGFAFNMLLGGPLARLRACAEVFRIRMQRFALLGLNQVAFIGAVWSLNLTDASYAVLPLVGISTLVAGAALGVAGSRFLRLPPGKAGVYIPSSSFTNIGSIGGLVIFVLVGEAGFALVPFYKLFEEAWYFSVLFPLAKRHGDKVRIAGNITTGKDAGYRAGDDSRKNSASGRTSDSGFRMAIRRILTDPFLMISLGSVSLGLILNFAGARRPAFYSGLNSVLIPLSSWIVLVTIGMRMKIGNLFTDARTTALLIGSRTVALPVFAVGLSLLLGLGRTENSIGLKTVLILSSMPIGFLGVVPPAMYGLDVEFSNRLWLISNSLLVVTVPVLSILMKLL